MKIRDHVGIGPGVVIEDRARFKSLGFAVLLVRLPVVFLEQLIVPGVVDVGVKQCCDLDVRVLLLEDAVVLHGLGNAGSR